MEKPAADAVDSATQVEQDGTSKANDDEKKTDYSSKAQNKTSFSDYLVSTPSLHLDVPWPLTHSSEGLYILHIWR